MQRQGPQARSSGWGVGTGGIFSFSNILTGVFLKGDWEDTLWLTDLAEWMDLGLQGEGGWTWFLSQRVYKEWLLAPLFDAFVVLLIQLEWLLSLMQGEEQCVDRTTVREA